MDNCEHPRGHVFATRSLVLLVIASAIMTGRATAADPVNHQTLCHSVSVKLGAEQRESASRVLFRGPYALAVPPEQVKTQGDRYLPIIYNLKEECWYDFNQQKWIIKSDWQSAEEAIKQRFEKELESASTDEERQFIGESLKPSLEVELKDGGLTIKGKFVQYDITEMKNTSADDRSRFYQFDRLSAMQKTIAMGRVPAQAQLKVDELLEARNIIPKRVALTMTLPAMKVLDTPAMTMAATSDLTFRAPTTAEVEITTRYLDILPPLEDPKKSK